LPAHTLIRGASKRGGGDVGDAVKFVTSIARQLANNIPSLNQHICHAFIECRDITSQTLHDQSQQLVLRPLSKLGENSGQSLYVLVIDALDDRGNDNNIRTIIYLLAEARSLQSVWLRTFLTSKLQIPIRHGLYEIPDAEHKGFVLHNMSPLIVDHDIRTFLERTFKRIARENFLAAGQVNRSSSISSKVLVGYSSRRQSHAASSVKEKGLQ
jgi:hypothetical protein